ncbi:hypothetical protein J1N09_02235 [Aureitalea sp. L0-47]|uniref:hypothetical protein n=1 Tax=Aureitalea sp. L0-47 TaxID=2816962 RepID=UPI002237D14A|nr:hypothetical protein [Aureitalea sp. L0-47]MCW5518641.1 hypothetical protein [Aureitalea sp. L0-47]
MKRIIVDYTKLDDSILSKLVEKYPYGYGPEDFIVFRNAKNEVIECVEVRTEDTIFLVKVSKRLVAAMEDFEEDEYSKDDEQDPQEVEYDQEEEESSYI